MPRYGGAPEQMHDVKVSGRAERVVNVLWRTERARLDELNASFPGAGEGAASAARSGRATGRA
jgi:hypothetical protein